MGFIAECNVQKGKTFKSFLFVLNIFFLNKNDRKEKNTLICSFFT